MIRVEQQGAVAVVLLDRPNRRNALTPEMLSQIGTLPNRLSPSARCLVLAGEGPAFCSGFDLSLCQADPGGSVMRSLLTGLFDAIQALRGLAIPVVGAVHGAAIAGGCALLGGMDFVITHEQASLGYPVVALGISPAVSAPFLMDSLGGGAARERMLDSALITGRQAQSLGLTHECLSNPEEVRPRALALGAQLAAKPPGAIAATRAWLRNLEDGAGRGARRRGLEVSLSLTGGPEERERLAQLRRP